MSGRTSSASRGSDRLAARRRLRRRRVIIAFGIFLILLGAGIVYQLWQSAVRISDIKILGADQSFAEIARATMQESYFGIIPYDSIFFFPASRIRANIIAAHPDVAAISIFRNGFSSISIRVDNRVPIARWCGVASAAALPPDSAGKEVVPTISGDCYLFDAGGFLYATATEAFFTREGISPEGVQASPDKTLTPFVLFSSLQADATHPVGTTLKDANQLPLVFDFARQLESLGLLVGTVVIRVDEVDFFLEASTQDDFTGPRITYLLGDEQNAFTALVSAKGQLKLSNPTTEYVDLRFPGKIYLKRTESPK